VSDNDLEVGQRVRYNYWPHCEGEIIKAEEQYPEPGPIAVEGWNPHEKKYRIRWDNADYGDSDWLLRDEITAI